MNDKNPFPTSESRVGPIFITALKVGAIKQASPQEPHILKIKHWNEIILNAFTTTDESFILHLKRALRSTDHLKRPNKTTAPPLMQGINTQDIESF